jgi:hypothetical protein
MVTEMKSAVGIHRPLRSSAGDLALERIQSQFERRARDVRTIPNICTAVSASLTGIVCRAFVIPWDLVIVQRTFNAIHLISEIRKSLFNALAAIAGYAITFRHAGERTLRRWRNHGRDRTPARVTHRVQLRSAKPDWKGRPHSGWHNNSGGRTIIGVWIIEEHAELRQSCS